MSIQMTAHGKPCEQERACRLDYNVRNTWLTYARISRPPAIAWRSA